MSKAGFWRWIALISLTGYGFNPLYCDYGPVEEARERLRALDGEGAEELLAREDIDAPEIHLSRALAHYQQSELSEMERALDEVMRHIQNSEQGGEELDAALLATLKRSYYEQLGLLKYAQADALSKVKPQAVAAPGATDAPDQDLSLIHISEPTRPY